MLRMKSVAGLRRTPIQLPAKTLAIDHIEKPSEN